jgi:hypothetical protein
MEEADSCWLESRITLHDDIMKLVASHKIADLTALPLKIEERARQHYADRTFGLHARAPKPNCVSTLIRVE